MREKRSKMCAKIIASITIAIIIIGGYFYCNWVLRNDSMPPLTDLQNICMVIIILLSGIGVTLILKLIMDKIIWGDNNKNA
jgi:TRAP-type C4-dicarboxylate transport system permease small subunit